MGTPIHESVRDPVYIRGTGTDSCNEVNMALGLKMS